MTRTSISEYTGAVRWGYLRVPRKEKGKILDEFTKVTGYHHKAVIRLLHRQNQPAKNKKRSGLFPVIRCRRGWGTTGRPGSY